MNKFVRLTIVLIIIMASYVSPISGFSTNKTSVKIAQVGDFFLYAPLYIALDANLFSQVGLEVSIINTGGDEKTWAAVLSGDADFGVGDPTFVAISAAHGRGGKVIASIVNGVPFWGVTWRQDIKPFNTTTDLNGYSVATFPAPSTAYTLQRQMFITAGKKPNIREGAFGALLTMAKSHRADIALELEPNVSQAVAQGGRVLYSLAEIYGDFAITGLTTSTDYLARSPETAAKVVFALQLALDKLHVDPEGALALLCKRFPEIKPDVAKAALERILKSQIIPQEVSIKPNAWQKAVDLRVSVGDIHTVGEMASYVDNSYADAALSKTKKDTKP